MKIPTVLYTAAKKGQNVFFKVVSVVPLDSVCHTRHFSVVIWKISYQNLNNLDRNLPILLKWQFLNCLLCGHTKLFRCLNQPLYNYCRYFCPIWREICTLCHLQCILNLLKKVFVFEYPLKVLIYCPMIFLPLKWIVHNLYGCHTL